MTRAYQLVIFDWDGTLVDSQAHIVRCMQAAFKAFELTVPEPSDIRHIVGLSLDKGLPVLAPDLCSEQIQQLITAYRQFSITDTGLASQFFEGVHECIQALHQQAFYLAIATGKGRLSLDAALAASGLDSNFHITRCAEETRSKPNPLMLEEILTDLNMTVDQAVMVGDTIYDIDMANNIGMDSVAVTYGMHSAELLEKSQPRYMVKTLAELAPLFHSAV